MLKFVFFSFFYCLCSEWNDSRWTKFFTFWSIRCERYVTELVPKPWITSFTRYHNVSVFCSVTRSLFTLLLTIESQLRSYITKCSFITELFTYESQLFSYESYVLTHESSVLPYESQLQSSIAKLFTNKSRIFTG